MRDPRQRHSLFGIYQSPQGDFEVFLEQVAELPARASTAGT